LARALWYTSWTTIRMSRFLSPHLKTVLQALLVTFLWSTSWVLIKIGLVDIPALSFAGLRYGLAFLGLIPLLFQRKAYRGLRGLPARTWLQLVLLGVLFYAITQGAQFISLVYLPAVTISLVLSFTTIVVGLLSAIMLAEKPTWMQWVGTGLGAAGALVYFYPMSIPHGEWIGMAAALAALAANALSSILGRSLNRSVKLPALTITVVSMGIGGLILLTTGLVTQGLPHLSWQNWGIILWLATVNSAFAFTLWNRTLQTLSAMESSIINNTMLFQIAILAWVFLDEELSIQTIAGLLLAALGTLLVQLRSKKKGALAASRQQ
jgi:drug/metabolite transporter (DMT)-like permease